MEKSVSTLSTWLVSSAFKMVTGSKPVPATLSLSLSLSNTHNLSHTHTAILHPLSSLSFFFLSP